MAWLAYRGEMISADRVHPAAISVFHAARLRASNVGSAMLQVERAIEAARVDRHPEAVSRLRGFYAFPDDELAKRAESWSAQTFNPAFRVEIGVQPDATISTHDADWITHDARGGPGPWIDAYLGGEPRSDDPHWEQIIDGRAYVWGTTVREWAGKQVLATWPASEGLLELARVAVELRSDLGVITAMALTEPSGATRISYVMSFKDATDPEFLRRFSEFKGPRNHQAMARLDDDGPVVPDLTSREFVLDLN